MTDEGVRCLFCGGPAEERHHVAGRRIDPVLIVDLCKACHGQIHREMEEAGVQLDGARRTKLEELVSFLRALATFLLALATRLFDWANLLAQDLGGDGGAAEVAS